MTCQNCGHPEGSHDIGHEGQPHYCVTVGGCPCTTYREPEPAVIENARIRSVHIVPEGEGTGHLEAVADLPDADAAWITFNTRNGGMTRYADNSNERDVFAAGFAAASGPWAEHLDAEAEPCGMPHPSHPEWLCDRPKGHDAHRRPGDVWRTDEDAWVAMVAERDAALARNAALERTVSIIEGAQAKSEDRAEALRAELDTLRETLAQKIEAHMRSEQIRVPEYETGLRRAAALVRGSDDE